MDNYEIVPVSHLEVGDKIKTSKDEPVLTVERIFNSNGSVTITHSGGSIYYSKKYLKSGAWNGLVFRAVKSSDQSSAPCLPIDQEIKEIVNRSLTQLSDALQKYFESKTPKEEPKSIMERVKTWEDAWMIKSFENKHLDPGLNRLLFSNTEDKELIAIRDYARMRLVAKVLNEGWEPDWSNRNERKHYPCFITSQHGGFYLNGSADVISVAPVGRCLCFKSEELAKYAGKQFIDLYNSFLK